MNQINKNNALTCLCNLSGLCLCRTSRRRSSPSHTALVSDTVTEQDNKGSKQAYVLIKINNKHTKRDQFLVKH